MTIFAIFIVLLANQDAASLDRLVGRLDASRFEEVSQARFALLEAPREPARAALVRGLDAESPQVRGRCADLLATLGEADDFAPVFGRLSEEPDPAVRDRLARAAARLGDGAERFVDAFRNGRIGESLFSIYQRERLLLLLQGTLRDGSIPGFYDGQFDILKPLGPGLVDQLFRVGKHPTLNLSLRGMAVAAIGSFGTADDVARLEGTFMLAPSDEIELLTDRSTEGDDQDRAKLSQYARWAAWRLGEKQLPLEPIRELERRFEQERRRYPRSADYLFEIGYGYLRLRLLDEAEKAFRKYVTLYDENGDSAIGIHLSSVRYNLACIASMRGEVATAIAELRHARSAGFSDMGWLLEDRDLENIRDDPRFRKFLEER